MYSAEPVRGGEEGTRRGFDGYRPMRAGESHGAVTLAMNGDIEATGAAENVTLEGGCSTGYPIHGSVTGGFGKMSQARKVTDDTGDADVGKSPIYFLSGSFPNIVSPVSSVTMVWLRGVSRIGPTGWWMADSLAGGLAPAGPVLFGPCRSPDASLGVPHSRFRGEASPGPLTRLWRLPAWLAPWLRAPTVPPPGSSG
jgi:hypothetical protein